MAHGRFFDPAISRRELLNGAAAGALAVGGLHHLSGCADDSTGAGAAALPDPAASGIEHIVLVMMENRSFDHFLG